MKFSRGAALDYLQSRFGGLLREREIDVTVGLAVAVAIPRDNERMSMTVMNLSANAVYLAPSSNVSATRCLRLAPNGGAISMNVDEDGLLPVVQWWGLAAGAGSTLYVLAVRREVRTSE
jgi:hypothetical protein